MASADPMESWSTRIILTLLAMAWPALLITVVVLKENMWFLLGNGLLGMLQKPVRRRCIKRALDSIQHADH
jgi:hypothetical protein